MGVVKYYTKYMVPTSEKHKFIILQGGCLG